MMCCIVVIVNRVGANSAHRYIPPGSGPENAILNSCSLERLAQTLQCSGRGVCRPWSGDTCPKNCSMVKMRQPFLCLMFASLSKCLLPKFVVRDVAFFRMYAL